MTRIEAIKRLEIYRQWLLKEDFESDCISELEALVEAFQAFYGPLEWEGIKIK